MNKKTILIGGGILALLGILWFRTRKKPNVNSDLETTEIGGVSERNKIYDDIYVQMMDINDSIIDMETGVERTLTKAEMERRRSEMYSKFTELKKVLDSMTLTDLKFYKDNIFEAQKEYENGDSTKLDSLTSDPLKYRDIMIFRDKYPQINF